MKKIVFFIAALLLLSNIVTSVYSATLSPTPQEATPSAKPTTADDSFIQEIKDKIATKVAELRAENKLAISGIISNINDSSFELKTGDDRKIQVSYDKEFATFKTASTSSTKPLKNTDLETDDYAVVSGLLLENAMTANIVYIMPQYIVTSAKITEVNKVDFSLKVTTADKDELFVDIETSTKQQLLDIKTEKLVVAGFSKYKEGDTLHFASLKQTDEKENRVAALHTLIIPQEYFIK